MLNYLRFLLPIVCIVIATSNLNAGLVTFGFAVGGGNSDNSAGMQLEQSGVASVITSDGITITLTASANNGGVFNLSNAGDDFGINAEATGDITSAFDGGSSDGAEIMTFSFTSSLPATIEFVSVDFDRIGSTDEARLAFAGGSIFDIDDGAVSSSDEFILDSQETLTQGQSISLAYVAGNGFGLERITLHVKATAVPEPSTVLMFGSALLSILVPRKRRR